MNRNHKSIERGSLGISCTYWCIILSHFHVHFIILHCILFILIYADVQGHFCYFIILLLFFLYAKENSILWAIFCVANYHWMPSMKNTLNARYANNVPWVTSLCNLQPSIFIYRIKMIRHSIMYSASFSLSSFFLSLSKMRKCCHQRCTLDACITNTSLFGVLLHCSHQLRNILYINVFVVKSSPFSTCNLHVFVTFNSP